MLNSSLKQKRGYDFSLVYLLISNEPSTYSKPVTHDFNQPCAVKHSAVGTAEDLM